MTDPYAKYTKPGQTFEYEPDLTPASLERDLGEPDIDWDSISLEQSMREEARQRHPQYNPETGRIEIKSVSHMHEAIINWLLLYPELSLRVCAEEFGITQSWLSTLKNSSLFKAKFAERQAEVNQKVTSMAAGLEDRMAGVAELGVARLSEMVENSTDPKFVLDATDKVLNRLGFGAKAQSNGHKPGQPQNVQNNFYVASTLELEEARSRMRLPPPPVEPALEVPFEIKENDNSQSGN